MHIKHPFIFWSDINDSIIRAIIQDKGYLKVTVSCEQNNPVDTKAIMVLLDVKTLLEEIGGTPANLNQSQGITANGYIRIGYLKWKDFAEQKANIYDIIKEQDGLYLDGVLTLDGNLNALCFERIM